MRHLKLYRAIRLIHRKGSIRKAAEVLSVSPSALNRSIQSFEEAMGTPVFNRIAGGVRLSSAGELLMGVIDRHLADHDALMAQISDLRDGLAGHLAISLGTDIDAGLVLEAITGFEHAHPGVSVEIVSQDGIEGLRQRRVELAVQTNPLTDDHVEVLHSVTVPLSAWRGGRGQAEGDGPLGLWDIAAERMLVPPEGTGTRSAISHLLRRKQLREEVTTTVTAAQVWQRLGAGNAVAVFPDPVLGPMAQAMGLRRLDVALGHVQCTVLRAARVPMSRPAQAMFALLQARLDAGEEEVGPGH